MRRGVFNKQRFLIFLLLCLEGIARESGTGKQFLKILWRTHGVRYAVWVWLLFTRIVKNHKNKKTQCHVNETMKKNVCRFTKNYLNSAMSTECGTQWQSWACVHFPLGFSLFKCKHLLLFCSRKKLSSTCLQFRLFCCFYSVDFVYFWHY